MISQELQELLKQPNNAIVATNRASGAPQLSPIWYLWDGEAFYFNTTNDRAKYTNIKRDPAISLIVDDYQTQRYVVAYGQAHIIEREDPQFVSLTTQIISKYGSAEDQEQSMQWAFAPNRIVIKLQVEKIVAQ